MAATTAKAAETTSLATLANSHQPKARSDLHNSLRKRSKIEHSLTDHVLRLR